MAENQPGYVKTIAKILGGVALFVGVAAAGGLGYAFYSAGQGPIVEMKAKERVKALEEGLAAERVALRKEITNNQQQTTAFDQYREAEKKRIEKEYAKLAEDRKTFEKHAFGTFEALSARQEKCSLTPEARELHVRAYLGNDIADSLGTEQGKIYDQNLQGMTITARNIASNGTHRLIITRADTQGLVSVNSYTMKRSSATIDDVLKDCTPESTILFTPDTIKVCEHQSKTSKVLQNNKVIYSNDSAVPAAMEEHAKKCLEEFKDLYARGLHPEGLKIPAFEKSFPEKTPAEAPEVKQ